MPYYAILCSNPELPTFKYQKNYSLYTGEMDGKENGNAPQRAGPGRDKQRGSAS